MCTFSTTTSNRMEAMEGTVSPKSHINGFHGEQTHSIPEPVHLKGEMACEMEKRSSQIGDYLDFVMWIRSLLLRMYPSLSQLKEDMPLISGLKWPERHAWGRQVDEECPSHWRVQFPSFNLNIPVYTCFFS